MNTRGEELERFEYYRGNELSGGSVENPDKVHESTPLQTPSAVEGNNKEDDIVSNEREMRLELWKEDIKAFIRQIDVSRL